ncbi:MAG: hypothetical protein U9N32_05965 [Spirochaetota bacterium]|nr:hypothetical protein [Spirochaetota bacterium]
MIREIIRPSTNNYNIHIPEEYINQEIEILILPFSRNEIDHLPEQNLKTLLANVSEGLEEDDLKRQNDFGREVLNWLT